MLIIEIASGIVLGWLIINHFDVALSKIADIIKGFFVIIFAPFRFFAKVIKAIYIEIKDNLFPLFAWLFHQGLLYILTFIVLIGIGVLLVKYISDLLVIIFCLILTFGYIIMIKELWLNFKDRGSLHWWYGVFLAAFFFITFVVVVVRNYF